MTYGVCMCVTGPPPGGVCQACGAVGPPLPWNPPPGTVQPQPNTLPPVVYVCPSEDELRRVVREEIERFREDFDKLAGE